MSDTATAETASAGIPAEAETLSAELAALRGRQDVAEMMLMMFAASNSRLDELVGFLESMRKAVAAGSNPSRRHAVEAFDSYLKTLRAVRDGCRELHERV